MTDTYIKPAFDQTRFTCPHCNEVSEHVWLNAYAHPINDMSGSPLRIQGADLERLSKNPQFPPEVREQKVAYWNRVNGGDVFLDRWAPAQTDLFVAGMELSACRSCMGVAIWLGGQMAHPRTTSD